MRICRRSRTPRSSCRASPTRPTGPGSGGCCSSGRSPIFKPTRCRSHHPQKAASPDGLAAESTAQQLQVAQSRLQILLLHAKPDHPDVRMMQRTIRDLEAKLEAESRTAGSRRPSPRKRWRRRPKSLRQQRIRDLKLQMDDIDRQLADKQEQEQQLRGGRRRLPGQAGRGPETRIRAGRADPGLHDSSGVLSEPPREAGRRQACRATWSAGISASSSRSSIRHALRSGRSARTTSSSKRAEPARDSRLACCWSHSSSIATRPSSAKTMSSVCSMCGCSRSSRS